MSKKIAVIDADLIGRTRHRFPNLVCMKLSGYYKDVELKLDYNNLEDYNRVFIAKVFTDTKVPSEVLYLPNVEYNGTGFFFDKAKPLPVEIEHCMPDYTLYNGWLNDKCISKSEFKFYINYSIGYLTRGCFRKCDFCVNQKYDRVVKHSPIDEFFDADKKKICLLDDNFFGYVGWHEELEKLQALNKPFLFKQGLDGRLLTVEKCKMLADSKYDGDYTFAFDSWDDRSIIESKLKLCSKYLPKQVKFYCLCAFDKCGKYDNSFWVKDMQELWLRIQMLAQYGCLPYIMRFNKYEESPYRGMYITIARWCNQPSLFKKMTLRQFVEMDGGKSSRSYLEFFLKTFPNAKFWVDNIRFIRR